MKAGAVYSRTYSYSQQQTNQSGTETEMNQTNFNLINPLLLFDLISIVDSVSVDSGIDLVACWLVTFQLAAQFNSWICWN